MVTGGAAESRTRRPSSLHSICFLSPRPCRMPRSRSRSRSRSLHRQRKRRSGSRSRYGTSSPLTSSRYHSPHRGGDQKGQSRRRRRSQESEEGDRDRRRRHRSLEREESPAPGGGNQAQGQRSRWEKGRGRQEGLSGGENGGNGRYEEERRDISLQERERDGRGARLGKSTETRAQAGAGREREALVPGGEPSRGQKERYEWGMPAISPLNGDASSRGEDGGKGEEKAPTLVAKPNFGLTGALAQDAQTGNVYKGVVLKWSEPDDARLPSRGWRLYVFKRGELKDTLHLHRQSAYLVGRHGVADLKVEHPSCSKQHAVLQFRQKHQGAEVKPYLMDLESVNKTRLNGEEVPPARYVELRAQDTIQFGLSSREYVLMHESLVGSS